MREAQCGEGQLWSEDLLACDDEQNVSCGKGGNDKISHICHNFISRNFLVTQKRLSFLQGWLSAGIYSPQSYM